LSSFFVACVFSFAYIKAMDCCATVLSWISVSLIQLLLIGVGVLAFVKRRDLEADGRDDTKGLTWLFWISIVSAAFFFIFVIWNLKSLRVSIAVIDTASDFVQDTKRALVIPVIMFIIGLIFSMLWLYGFICVCSIGTITPDDYAL